MRTGLSPVCAGAASSTREVSGEEGRSFQQQSLLGWSRWIIKPRTGGVFTVILKRSEWTAVGRSGPSFFFPQLVPDISLGQLRSERGPGADLWKLPKLSLSSLSFRREWKGRGRHSCGEAGLPFSVPDGLRAVLKGMHSCSLRLWFLPSVFLQPRSPEQLLLSLFLLPHCCLSSADAAPFVGLCDQEYRSC